ncbi:uncharacterized protein LOC120397500 isoform X1 [Mauremys reevesii]|uniref:uncharacterized protein LOC120397500 isoform X1 n=1 Tax=Mauremys reevesii TaxID=260615 RepID=UPI00193F06D3|nr:uncharacterized protein LOC120397500 isoform X1 [Mauremys reevesii]
MAQAGPAWGASPHACRGGGHHGRIDRSGLLPSCEDEADDWETDPDCINDATERGFWSEEGHGAGSEFSIASIISDLSNSIRGCELTQPGTGKPGAPPALSYENRGHQHPPPAEDSHLRSSRETTQRSTGPGTGAPLLRPYPSVYLHSSAGTGIERASVFECNAAEKLDTFFYEKLKACEEAPVPPCPARGDSSAYENEELLGEEPGPEAASRSRAHSGTGREGQMVHQKGAQQGSLSRQDQGGRHRQSHTRQRNRRRDSGGGLQRLPSSGAAPDPAACDRSHGPFPPGDGTAAGPGWEEGRGCSRPCLEAGGPPRILPHCVIAHLQSCLACQRFNQSLQAWPGEEAAYQNSWAPREEESAPSRRARSAAPSQRQLRQRLSEVQKWLEQFPAEEPSLCPGPETHRAPSRFYVCDSCRNLDQKEGGTWRRLEWDRDPGSLKQPAEPRAARGSRRGKSEAGSPPHRQPVARSLGHQELNAATVPQGTCSYLFCERQRRGLGCEPGWRRGGHASESWPGACSAAEDASAKLQAESRVQRIVEAFERRSRREAKAAAQEKLFQAARQRELDRRARAVAAKEHRGARLAQQPQSGSRPPRSHSRERRREAPRPEAVTEGRPQGSRRKGDAMKKKTSLVEKLKGHH